MPSPERANPVRIFAGTSFKVHVQQQPEGTYRLRVTAADSAIKSNIDMSSCTGMEAFELSRLLRLGASFVEWIEDYGVDAADEWSGQSPQSN